MLLKLADAIEARADELGRLESKNAGKPVGAAIDEIPVVVDNLRFFAGAARVMEGKAANEYMAGHTSMIRREPVGVVASIAPWNYPIMMAGWKIGPALAAGNTVVLKPSARTPLTALRPGRDRVGDPAARRAQRHHRARARRSATRSSGTRRSGWSRSPATPTPASTSRRIAADQVKRLHLELGGKAPVIVFDDADLDAVAETIKLSGYWNAGQDCTAATRVIAGPKILTRSRTSVMWNPSGRTRS